MRALATSMALLITASVAVAAEDPACSTSGSLPEGAVFVGYTRPHESQLKSLALLVSKKLRPYDGHNLHVGLALHEAATPSPGSSEIAAVNPSMERMGKNHCEYPAELSLSPANVWRIWVSDRATALRGPSPAERDSFRKLEPKCVSSRDPEAPSQCVYTDLVAVSDLDENGLPEYWHTLPYGWDIGLTVSELTTPSSLEKLLSACPGCSD